LEATKRGNARSVQSVERAFTLLELLADAGGSLGLSQLAASSGLPLPTIHRLMSTLTARGYIRRESSRRYSLGPRLVRLGEGASRAFGVWAQPSLAKLAARTGETANMAMLDGDAVVYVAQAPSAHSMRMFTEPGHRVPPHCTGVGKALLAQLAPAEVRTLLTRTGMSAQTEKTITDLDRMLAELKKIAEDGYAIDDNENEVGVKCVAVPVRGGPSLVAISVSGPQARMDSGSISRMIPALMGVAAELSAMNSERDATE
jgi:IclR family acetate operon transcriptional repressor